MSAVNDYNKAKKFEEMSAEQSKKDVEVHPTLEASHPKMTPNPMVMCWAIQSHLKTRSSEVGIAGAGPVLLEEQHLNESQVPYPVECVGVKCSVPTP